MTRDSWTDERLNDLSKRVDDGFKDVRAEMRGGFSSVRSEIRTEFASVRKEIGGLRGEIASLQRTLLIGFFGVIASILGAVVAAILGHAL